MKKKCPLFEVTFRSQFSTKKIKKLNREISLSFSDRFQVIEGILSVIT